MSDTSGFLTATAISLALVAAVGFGIAAVLQHRVVTATPEEDGKVQGIRLGVDALWALAHQRRWVTGWVLFGAASTIHLIALVLAPLDVVQPVGVFAVPVAVLLESYAARRFPAKQVLIGVALSMIGTGGFVLLTVSGRSTTVTSPTLSGVVTALAVVSVAVVVLRVAAQHGSPLVAHLAYAAMGAVCFGLSSALIRVTSRAFGADGFSTLVILTGLVVVCVFAVGAWAVQQAYASGPAAAVVGSLTVGDPLVGIVLSAVLLGEGLTQGVVGLSLLVGCGAVAASGVLLLARHYPAAGLGSDRETTGFSTQPDPYSDEHPQLLAIGDQT